MSTFHPPLIHIPPMLSIPRSKISVRLLLIVTTYDSCVRHSGVGVYAKVQDLYEARVRWESSA